MSLKFFFNRKGPLVLTLLAMGWLATVYHLLFSTRSFFFIVFCLLGFVITLIRFYPWYKPEDRGSGIEEHFEKTMVPASYIIVVTNIVYHFWPSWPFLLFSIVLLAVIQSVNFILLYFHFRDKDPTPPSYFTRNLYR